MQNERKISIGGMEYLFTYSYSGNKRAIAKLDGNIVQIKIPKWWPKNQVERTVENLEKRAISGIESGKWNSKTMKKIEFSEGQRIRIFGKEFLMVKKTGKKSSIKKTDYFTIIEIPGDFEFSKSVMKILTRELQPIVEKRVLVYNDAYLQAMVRKVRLRDTTSRWGSCSRDGKINLNFRLLFAPEEILDYVIVHELAHLKHKNHGAKFWELMDKIMPNHKERRKWLRENGHRIETRYATSSALPAQSFPNPRP